MSLFSNLTSRFGGLTGGAAGQDIPSMLSGLLSESGVGGLQGVVSRLQQGGLGEQVSSWLGSGSNLPISADQLRSVLGEPVVQQITAKLGLPTDAVMNLLAQHLPTAVDKASPDGAVPSDDGSQPNSEPQA